MAGPDVDQPIVEDQLSLVVVPPLHAEYLEDVVFFEAEGEEEGSFWGQRVVSHCLQSQLYYSNTIRTEVLGGTMHYHPIFGCDTNAHHLLP